MKKLMMVALGLWTLVACRPDPYEEIGPDYSLTEGIAGTWQIAKVEVVDLTRPVPESRDITDYYLQSGAGLALTFDPSDGEYLVEDASAPGNVFGMGGSFAYDDPEFPEMMMMVAAQDTTRLELGNMVRQIDNEMSLLQTRNKCGEAYLRYRYTFKRSTP